MNRNLVAFLFLLLSISLQSNAQQNDPKMLVQNIRIDVYTRVLQLTPDEAKKFWPVFDEMEAKLKIIQKASHIERTNISDNYDKLTDDQMSRSLDNLLDLEQQALDLKKKYYQKFKKILPIKKVVLIPKADREFQAQLLKYYQGIKDSEE